MSRIITDEQIIVISDTHIGSIYENISYLNDTYDFAIKHSIHTVIHCGDLIQSTYRNHNKKYYNDQTQIEHLLKVYPSDSSIVTNILLGNHDYHTIRKSDDYREQITSRKDFTILGIKDANIIWQDIPISIHHHCPRYNITIPNINSLLTFCGHSHKLSITNNHKIYVPTLSDDLKSQCPPGFLITTIIKNNVYVEFVPFNPTLDKPELVLTKHI